MKRSKAKQTHAILNLERTELNPMVPVNLRKIWNPELFQGKKSYKNYFEGWYFKLVDAAEAHILAVIPGISLGEDNEDSHAFIQVFNGKTGDFEYFTFPVDAFSPSSKNFAVTLGKNQFSAESLTVDLNQSGQGIRGELHFENVIPYPKRFFAPGLMGWGSFVPFMQCKHGIVSMNHTLQGTLEIDGEQIAFDKGKGYIEKDWGHSFPSSYIWMQSNHFTDEGISFMLALARIPWLHTNFSGFAGLLWYNGRFHKFATYTGAQITHFEKQEQNLVRITLEDRHFKSDIEAIQGSVWKLKSPHEGTMTHSTFESLTSTINLKVYEKTSGGKRLLFEDHGRNAGLEIMDDTDELLHDLNK
ncbi:MAG TPA: tocopherol cyclase family protein [Desulfobacteria bacterium]|nr:tocopherol cyclase family protein [Desulfobacteria bacterium]